MTRTQFELLETESRVFYTGARTRSTALLAWFLSTAWRLDPDQVEDSICDGGGDKGIDALVVDDDLREITIFQAKHRTKSDLQQGDADLKNLVGAAALFENAKSVNQLVKSAPNPELLRLLDRLDIATKVSEGAHATRLVFVTNAVLDRAGRDYVRGLGQRTPVLDVWDRPRLAAVAARTRRPELRPDTVKLRAAAAPTHLPIAPGVNIAAAIVPAQQLVQMPGITDFTLFDRNVRLGLGKTRINRELSDTVRNPLEHRFFPAYHNGLTILTNGLNTRGRNLELHGVSVVNGCQSLLALYRNRADLSPELNLLVKVVQVAPESDLPDKITYRANNQNPVDIRDQRSTDAVQRDLQAQVSSLYGDKLFYVIRDGENPGAVPALDNQLAAQLLMAMYVKEPWNAVRKVRLFDDDYRRIFNRDVDAARLLLLHVVAGVLEGVRSGLSLELRSSFSSVRLTLAYLLAVVLRMSPSGRRLLDEPEQWLPTRQKATMNALRRIAAEIVDTVNFYVNAEREEKGDKFDPKTVFKSQQGVRDVEREVQRDTKRHAKRDPRFLFDVRFG